MSKDIRIIRSSMPPLEEYVETIKPLWESCWLSNSGVIHNELESQLTRYAEVENLNLFMNGNMALQIAIETFCPDHGEAITTPFTFAATTHSIVLNGLTPVFCDIDPNDCNIDVNKIEALITEKTTAIIPVHIYGNPCDVDEIDRIARKYDLKVVYDAAQAFGVKLNGRGIGTFGDASAFSFHGTKTFHTIEGGAVTYKDGEKRDQLTKLANYGKSVSSDNSADYSGYNAKMNEFQAAMGICNLRHLEDELAKRKAADEHYRSRIENVKGISLISAREGTDRNYTYFPILVDEKEYAGGRENLAEKLMEQNIYPRKYFSPLTVDFNCYKGKFTEPDIPTARYVVDHVLLLPMHAYLTSDDVDRICDIIEGFK